MKIPSEITQPLTISLSTLADKSRGRISSSTIKTGAKVFLGGTTSVMEKLIKALFFCQINTHYYVDLTGNKIMRLKQVR